MRQASRLDPAHVLMLGAALAEGTFGATFFGYGPLYMRETLGWAHLSRITLTTGLASLVTFVMAAAWGRQGDRTGRPLALVASGLGLAASLMLALSLTRGSGPFMAEAVATAAALAAVPGLAPAWQTLRHPDRPAQAVAGFYRARTAGWFVGSIVISVCVREFSIAVLPHVLQAVAAGSGLIAAGLWIVQARPAASRRSRPPLDAATPGVGAPTASLARAGFTAEPQLPAASPATELVPSEDAAFRPERSFPHAAGQGRAWRNPAVLSVALYVLFVACASEAFFALLGPYLTEYLHGSTDDVGLTLGGSSLLGMAVLGPIGRLADRYGPHRVLRAAALGYVIMFSLSILVRDPLATAIIYTLPMYPLATAGATGWLAYRTPPSVRGEAVGICEGTAALAGALGALASGAVADALGLAWVPAASLVSASVGLAIAWFLVGPSEATGSAAPREMPRPAAGR
ncbi:MAG: MFS transporter [Clostridia bacterium]|nr:MFS transporter [Clostridia bacterium]